MTDSKTFADGFIAKRHENAPDFVTCSLSIRVEEAIKFLTLHQKEGWVNLQVKQAKSGKYYCELDTWRPTQGEVGKAGMEAIKKVLDPTPAHGFADDDIPF